jgi:hypothetical protein
MPPESVTPAKAQPGVSGEAVAGVSAEKRKRKMLIHTLAYVAGGAILGFAYHKIVGCRSGACPITANPYISTIYGALIGFFASGGLGR